MSSRTDDIDGKSPRAERIGIHDAEIRDASVVRGIGVLPMFAGLLGLLLLIGSLAATWAREGR